MRRLLLVLAALIAIGAVAVGVVAFRSASQLQLDTFDPPSDAKVRRDLERFYARSRADDARSRGELRGCFSRHAELWF